MQTRYWPIFINSKKVAEAHEQSFDVNPNKSILFDAEGAAGLAIGAAHTQMTLSAIDPIGGTTIDWIAQALQTQLVEVAFLQPSGTFVTQQMTVTNVQKKSNAETGRSDISVTFLGLAPKET
ncbi:MAG TPA: hypothetical protein VGH28_13840 [Polyangiaceae bacterium]